MAIHIWGFTAFSVVPKNVLIRRYCLIHLKNIVATVLTLADSDNRQQNGISLKDEARDRNQNILSKEVSKALKFCNVRFGNIEPQE
jgi:hypothetical protein